MVINQSDVLMLNDGARRHVQGRATYETTGWDGDPADGYPQNGMLLDCLPTLLCIPIEGHSSKEEQKGTSKTSKDTRVLPSSRPHLERPVLKYAVKRYIGNPWV